jgi:succinate-semialdehyde dehydrogenase/glutarate-semialdehyde dehydrogenase
MTAYAFPPQIPSFIAGLWVPGQGTTTAHRDKFTSKPLANIQAVSQAQVTQAVASVNAARAKPLSAFERGDILFKASQLIRGRTEELVQVMRAEVGFTDIDAQGEVSRCAQTLTLCAEEARRLHGDVVPMEGAPGQADRLGFTLRVPLGTVCAITPFNSPLNTVAHKIGPALAAGNAVVLKPSLHTPHTANILAEVLLEAGLPAGLLCVLHGDGEVGQWLLEEHDLQFFAFTGSTAIGGKIQQRIGLRRSQMELGSIAHVIVDQGADLARAVPRIIGAGFRKAGQVCTSTQTVLVHRDAYDATVRLLEQHIGALQYGDPAASGCTVGPLISEAAAQRVESWIAEAVSQGARKLVGGARTGSVVAPTLLVDTQPHMKVREHEVFGPVLSVVPFTDFEDALATVNGTPYGLASGVFTNSLAHAWLAARTLRVGAVHINEASSSRADLMPFGGTKDSGFGREGPQYAIREMTEERLVTFSL